MIRRTHMKPGFIAALLHRLSGIALAIFLPLHFLALGTALSGADRLDAFFNLTHNIWIRTAEWGLVTALALHLALGLRVLVLESAGWPESTASVVSGCVAGSLAIGILFLLNAL
jgi:fumarate reductase subunit D